MKVTSSVNIISSDITKNILIKGRLGWITQPFEGNDLIFYKNKIFCYSQSSKVSLLSKIYNYSRGVTSGYFVELEFVGLGFRFIKVNNSLLIKLGFSHYISFDLPKGVHVFGYKRMISFFGLSLEQVKLVSSQLRKLRKLDIYKGKGIRLKGDVLKLKVGKQK